MRGYRMLFGVPDEITDVTRVSGMVRKQRLIYRKLVFGIGKVFGHCRECTGSDELVPGIHREGPTHPGVSLVVLGWCTSP